VVRFASQQKSNMTRGLVLSLSTVGLCLMLTGCRGNRTAWFQSKSITETTPVQTTESTASTETELASNTETTTSTSQDDFSANAQTSQVDETLWNDAVDFDASLTTQPTKRASSDYDANYDKQAYTDTALNLFGEVDGVGGLNTQFGASENVLQVTYASEGRDFDPTLDRTGQYLAFASTQHSRSADIYIKPVQGQTVTQLTNDPADDIMPKFSPDNSQIVFCSKRSGNWDIYVMDVSGGPTVQITSSTAHEIHPSWSPDGKYLVYCRLSEQSGRWEMWTTEVEDMSVRNFIGYGLFPEWSPDPADPKIAYQKARERGSRLFGIWTIDFDNGEGRRPTEIVSAANAAAIGPAWSADGKMLAFATVLNPDQFEGKTPSWSDVWVVNVDGSNKVNVTNGEYANLQPTWGPGGQVYFVSNRSGIDNVWVVEPGDAIEVAQGPHSYRDSSGDTSLAEVPTDEDR